MGRPPPLAHRCPGLVATMLRDADLSRLGVEATQTPSATTGVCYRVGDADAGAVLDALDVREKGGYTREIIEVFPLESDERPPVRALLYTGTPDNPNFTVEHIKNSRMAAAVIACAHGPSGPNTEYLFELEKFLQSVNALDPHVEELCRLTRQLLHESPCE
mmetsp:Transcript_55371/g.127283  ORF Transcript_55371/g.127283 Transcript_55371/m.127283 type:complete len:161 (-) Transcript_55371:263-745(-)